MWRYGREPTEDEWADISRFMQQNCPRRWDAYQALHPNQQGRLKMVMANSYWTLQRLQRSDPQIYDLRMQRLPIEDEIFGLAHDMKASDGPKEAMRAQMAKRLAEWFDIGLKIQQLRVAQLESQLTSAKERLTEQQTDRDRLIKRQLTLVEKNGGNLGEMSQPLDPPERPGDQPFAAPKEPAHPSPTTAPHP